MEHEFWHAKWESNEIGFHEQAVHPLLETHWAEFGVPATDAVLVPLCGKSLDMVWLRERGHPVVGAEISPIALRDFFAENNITATPYEDGSQTRFEGSGYRLFCGDFQTLTRAQIGPVTGLYDRAALIALPPPMRPAYARRCLELLPGGARMFAITLQFDPATFTGPPFPVSHDEVARLYAGAAHIEHLEQTPTRVKGKYDVLQTATLIVTGGT